MGVNHQDVFFEFLHDDLDWQRKVRIVRNYRSLIKFVVEAVEVQERCKDLHQIVFLLCASL